MEITWEVDDGYIGKSRPQYTTIDDSELEYCETEADKEEIIRQYIQEDFDQRISWYEKRRSE